jgi:hypothetical protein
MKACIILLCAVILGSTACQSVKEGATMTDKGTIVFEDSFDKGLFNWTLEEWDGKVKVDLKDGQLHMTTDSKINGGMVWCKKEVPENFIFEFDVTPLSQSGFFLLFFNTQGPNGKDILSPELFDNVPEDVTKFENCIFYKYTRILNGYHMSYRRNESATCNFRKNAGLILLKQQKLDKIMPKDQTMHVELYKKGGHMKLTVDGMVFMDHVDDGKAHGPVWTGGRVGFRQVYESDGLYDNIRMISLPE